MKSRGKVEFHKSIQEKECISRKTSHTLGISQKERRPMAHGTEEFFNTLELV